jgi:phosphoribosyl 1,2-cyclic phosphodiesterase
MGRPPTFALHARKLPSVARRAYLVHMTHDLDHEATERSLPALPEVPGGVRLA